MTEPPVWRNLAAVAAIAAVSFVAVTALAAHLSGSGRLAAGNVVATATPNPCCLRRNVNPDLASAELQQAVASAIVQSGGSIAAMRAQRPSGVGATRKIVLDLTFKADESATMRALARIAILRPHVGVAQAAIHPAGREATTELRLVQWVRLTNGAQR